MKIRTIRTTENFDSWHDVRHIVFTPHVLRYAVVSNETIEMSIVEEPHKSDTISKHVVSNIKNEFIVVNIIPTGVGAEFGGYIADATPITNVMASIADKVITHPNVLNGSYINYAASNIFYVEGYSLDQFLMERLSLKNNKHQNKIGVIIDKRGFEEDGDFAINTIESLRAILGINVIGIKITKEYIGGKAILMPSGAFAGEVENPKTLIEAALYLKRNGANAIAIATYIDMKEEHLNAYFRNEIPNPMGGTEALISHLISKEFKLPCAHAPIISKREKELYLSKGIVDPRCAAEVVSPGYLGCILKGLNLAPQLGRGESTFDYTVNDIDAIVIPYGCCGGVPVIAAQMYGIPIIAVKENKTVLNVTPEVLKLKNVIVVDTYLEAFGVLNVMKAKVSLESVKRPLKKLGND